MAPPAVARQTSVSPPRNAQRSVSAARARRGSSQAEVERPAHAEATQQQPAAMSVVAERASERHKKRVSMPSAAAPATASLSAARRNLRANGPTRTTQRATTGANQALLRGSNLQQAVPVSDAASPGNAAAAIELERCPSMPLQTATAARHFRWTPDLDILCQQAFVDFQVRSSAYFKWSRCMLDASGLNEPI
jgi:hypothetical protein